MSFIDKTAFEARGTNNDRDNLSHVAGRYQVNGADADCSAGLLCVRGANTPCQGFTGVLNENAWYMTAASADANIDSVIYACDPYDWQLLQGKGGNAYAVGRETLGLGAIAGRECNYTNVIFDNKHWYRFGEGNLSAAADDKKFFTIADGLLVPAAAAPTAAGSIYFELKDTGAFTEGTTASFGYVDVIAMRVSVAAA